MGNENTKKELELPSSYDYYYFDLSIFKTFFDINKVEEHASSELNINFRNNIRGVFYLFELVLIDILHHLEGLIKNYNISDVIHWSHSSIQEEAVRKLIEAEPIIKYIFEFNSLRKKLAKIRTNNGPPIDGDITEFVNIIKSIGSILDESNKFLIQNLGIQKVNGPEIEKSRILNWFLVKYNYIEGHFKFLPDQKKEIIICSYPGGIPFFNIMPDETSKSYHLQHTIIKNYNLEYLNGYKIMLLFFYKKYLVEEHYNKAKDLILNAKTWHDIHKAYGRLIRLIKNHTPILTPLFKITNERLIKEIVPGTKVTAKYELDLIFRRINNLKIKVIRSKSYLGEPNVETLFYHVLFGAEFVQDKNIEIIEFKQFFPDDDRIEFSYAIFMPVTSSISDSSYWLFFDELALASINDPYESTSKIRAEHYLKFLSELPSYRIKSYEIQGDLLKKYIYNKDIEEFKTSALNEQIKASKGLLGEFIAYLFLAKKYSARLVDISKYIGSTDIDVIAENNDSLFLVQAKASFPFTKQNLEDIFAHFNTISKVISTKKKVIKILFLMNEDADYEDEIKYMDDDKIEGLSEEDIENRKVEIKKELKSKGIDIYSYNDLRELMSSREYTNFISKVDGILDYSDYDISDDF